MYIEDVKIKRIQTAQDISRIIEFNILEVSKIFETEEIKENVKAKMKEQYIKGIEAEQIVTFYAEINSSIVGKLEANIYYEIFLEAFTGLKASHIYQVCVLPEYRRKGICTKLVESFLTYAKRHEVGKVVLHSGEENINLYQECGFGKVEKYYPMYTLLY